MAGGDIRYIITVDSAGATKAIQEWDGELKKSADNAEKAETQHSSLWKQFALGQVAANALMAGVGFLGRELKSTVTAAMEAEQSQRNLELALQTTGRAVSSMLPALKSHASEVQRMTVYDDDAVMSVQALLAQLTELDEHGLKRATEGTVGLAAVFKMDLQAAGNLVAKAMAGNISALSRYGITVAENIPLDQKRAQLLEQLSVMYERAKGETETFGGSLKQLGNMWGDLKEEVGGAIVQNTEVKKTINELSKAISELTVSGDFQSFIGTVAAGLRLVIKLAKEARQTLDTLSGSAFASKLKETRAEAERYAESMKPVIDVVNTVAPAHRELAKELGLTGEAFKKTSKDKDAFKENVKVLNTVIDESIVRHGNLSRVVGGAAGAFRDMAYDVQTAVPPARELNDIIGQAPDRFEDMAWGAKKATTESRNYISLLFDDMRRGFASTIKDWMSGATTFGDFLKGLWGNVKDAFFGMIGEMVAEWTMNFLKKIVTSTTEAVTDIAKGAGDLVKGIGNALSGGLASGIGSFVGTFLGTLLGGGGGLGKTEGHWIHEIRDRAYDIMHTVDNAFANLEDIRANYWPTMTSLLDGIKKAADYISDVRFPALMEALKPLTSVTQAATGWEGVVSRPTLFMAGERGPEHVTVKPPDVTMGATTLPVIVDGHEIMRVVMRYLPTYSKAGQVQVHTNALVSY